ncbi:class I SAM-dependent methyltransferase [Phreatobacter sp.]|uniref:class I SAM-dependent methyltransferase n=1 Tax=Phreatobacter sp. TaxID=1966341 RepID=UPI003F725A72
MNKAFFDNPEAVAAYEQGPRWFVPAYEASHDMATVLLQEFVAETGHILVVGAGGGIELAALAQGGPHWRFTGVDPAGPMIEMARGRLAAIGALDRVDLIQGFASDAPAGPFDAATCFLTLHFVPDDGARLATLQDIRSRLKPGAPFLLINGCLDKTSARYPRDMARYSAFARFKGAPDELTRNAAVAVTEQVHLLPAARDEALLGEAGFHSVEPFYRGLWVHGWLAHA